MEIYVSRRLRTLVLMTTECGSNQPIMSPTRARAESSTASSIEVFPVDSSTIILTSIDKHLTQSMNKPQGYVVFLFLLASPQSRAKLLSWLKINNLCRATFKYSFVFTKVCSNTREQNKLFVPFYHVLVFTYVFCSRKRFLCSKGRERGRNIFPLDELFQ